MVITHSPRLEGEPGNNSEPVPSTSDPPIMIEESASDPSTKAEMPSAPAAPTPSKIPQLHGSTRIAELLKPNYMKMNNPDARGPRKPHAHIAIPDNIDFGLTSMLTCNSSLTSKDDPKDIKDACESPDWDKWDTSNKAEINQLITKGVVV
ncbi:hypothetical protein HGRIS_000043 [Hohenbuehelia grisea]|uniref:Prolactin receptor n=1 Tax=Hohenbuehelia grisea TaxID=104357 RepID=A0ABR3JPW6_9AGAR